MMQKIKTTLWLQALLIAIIIIFSAGGYVFVRQLLSKTKQPDTGETGSQSIDIAIAKGEQYLLDNFSSIDARQRLVLDYLQRKFALNEMFDASKHPISVDVENQDIKNEMQAMMRIANPSQKIGKIPFKNIVLESLNCDHIALPQDFKERMQQDIAAGAYELTHAALSLKFLAENKCSVDFNQQELGAKLSEQMVAYVQDVQTSQDLRYESIAFLLMLGERGRVQSSWINQIATEQNSDGGWSPATNYSRSDDHATVLALWALLEYARPDTPDQPIIRQ